MAGEVATYVLGKRSKPFNLHIICTYCLLSLPAENAVPGHCYSVPPGVHSPPIQVSAGEPGSHHEPGTGSDWTLLCRFYPRRPWKLSYQSTRLTKIHVCEVREYVPAVSGLLYLHRGSCGHTGRAEYM